MYDPYPNTLHGVPLDRWGDHELRRLAERAMEQAVAARKYGGPAYAAMYEAELRKVMREQDRRAGR